MVAGPETAGRRRETRKRDNDKYIINILCIILYRIWIKYDCVFCVMSDTINIYVLFGSTNRYNIHDNIYNKFYLDIY